MSKFENLIGERYGRLEVVSFAGYHEQPSGKRRTLWRCRCDCGNYVDVMAVNLKKGNTKSCGCYNIESIKSRFTKHGDRHCRLYSIWSNMKTRCYDKSNKTYEKYGARGIRVCDEWLNSYEAFKAWAVSNGYDESLSIDRIDVNGDYCPQNCRWVDAVVQANNRTNTLYVSAHGETHSLSEWASLCGVKYHTLYARIFKAHVSPDLAIPFQNKLAV